jgi:hypothetical protein
MNDTHVWEDNVKIGILEVGWGYKDWIDLVHDRERCWVGSCEGGDEHLIFVTYGEFLD